MENDKQAGIQLPLSRYQQQQVNKWSGGCGRQHLMEGQSLLRKWLILEPNRHRAGKRAQSRLGSWLACIMGSQVLPNAASMAQQLFTSPEQGKLNRVLRVGGVAEDNVGLQGRTRDEIHLQDLGDLQAGEFMMQASAVHTQPDDELQM